jgi:hypothetical protein
LAQPSRSRGSGPHRKGDVVSDVVSMAGRLVPSRTCAARARRSPKNFTQGFRQARAGSVNHVVEPNRASGLVHARMPSLVRGGYMPEDLEDTNRVQVAAVVTAHRGHADMGARLPEQTLSNTR